MKGLLPFILSLLICCQAYGQITEEQAKSAFADQDYLTSLKAYEYLYEQDTFAKAYLEKAALSASRAGISSKAKKYFTQLENHPTLYKSACINLGNIYEQQENLPKAIKYNRRLKDSFPDNPSFYRKLGNLYLKANLPTEAFPAYATALELNPNDVVTLKSMAEMVMSNDQHQLADTLIRRGLEIDSTNYALRLLHARNFYRIKQYDSTTYIMHRLEGRIDFSNYYNKMYGFALLQIDSVDQAIFYLNKSLVNEGDPEFAHYYLGNAYEMKGDMESAVYNLNKAIEAGISKNADLYYRSLARIENERNNLKEALKAYDWAYKLNPDPVLLFYLARASDTYYADKNIAIRYYQRYLKSNHDEASYKKYTADRIRYLKELKHQRAVVKN